MANSEQNEIVDRRKSWCQKTDRIMYCIILNATDELLSKLNHNCVLKIHTFFNDIGDLMRFTERKTQSKQVEFVTKTTKDIEMLRKVREGLSTCDSSSQIEDKVINADTLDKIKKETMSAIIFATHFVAARNQVHCKNLPRAVKDFAHPRVLLRVHVENATLDNVILGCGCALRSIGTGTQSDTANGEFSSETSLDAPEKACGKKRRVDFIPEEIAKVSDTLTAEPRPVCDVVTEDTVLYARKTVMPMADGTEEETSRGRESLISPVIDAKEKSDIATATDVATDALQREFSPIRSAEIPQDSSALSDEAFQVSRLDESLDANGPALLPVEEMRTHDDVMSVEHIEKNDSLDVAAITAVVTSEKKEERQEENEVSLQLTMDQDIPDVDETALDVTVSSTVTDLAEESTIQEPAYPAKDTLEESISTKYKIPLSEKTRAIKVVKIKQSPTGEPTPPAQDMFPESVQIKHKMPWRRRTWTAKKTDELETSPARKPTQPAKDMFQESVQFTYGMPRFKKTRTIKDTAVETSPAGEEPTQLTKDTFQDSAQTKYRASRFKRTRTIIENETSPAGEPTPLANDVLRKSTRPVQQTVCNAARPRKNQRTRGIESCSTSTFASFAWPKTTKRSCDYLERSTTGIGRDCRQLRILQPRCCGGHHDTSRSSLRNAEATRNAASDHVCCPFPRDPCVSRCRGGYWWWGRTCDTTGHGKYGATVGNSLHAHAYCNGDTGHYCPHLNAIDNCRTGHCHWDDGRSVWNDDRHYGRS